MHILAVNEHFDDIELGCKTILKKLSDQGHTIFYYVGTTSEFSSASTYEKVRTSDAAEKKGRRAAELMELKLECGDFVTFDLDYSHKLNTVITQLMEKHRINLMLTQWRRDTQQGLWGLSVAVFLGTKPVKKVLAYRSSWYAADTDLRPNFFVDISDSWNYNRRLLQCFESDNSYVEEKWIRFCETTSTSSVYGMKNDCKYAEGFERIRWLQ